MLKRMVRKIISALGDKLIPVLYRALDFLVPWPSLKKPLHAFAVARIS